MKNTPVYRYPWTYAQSNGEETQYRESMNANVSCKEAIDNAIGENYKGWCLDTDAALAQLLDQFSMERIQYVLANTIQHKDWDGRFSTANKAWAKGIIVGQRVNDGYPSSHLRFVVDRAHPGLVDLLTTKVRKQSAENAL